MKQKIDRFMWLMSIKENKSTAFYYGYLVTIGVIFYLMNIYTPMFSDDWHYCFIYGTTTPIETIGDIFKSQYSHYFQQNGRFTSHFIVQFFDGITTKDFFNFANAICLTIFLHLIVKTTSNQSNKYPVLSFTAFLLFFLTPGFKYNFLWMSGACNYLWSATLLLYFNKLIKDKITNIIFYPLLFLYGIICGWTHEGLVLGISLGYILYFILHKSEFKVISRRFLLIGFLIGVTLCIISPGSISRAMSSGIESEFKFTDVFYRIFSSLLYMNNIRILPLFLIIICIQLSLKHIQLKKYIKDNIVWLIAIVVNFIFLLWTKHTSAYSRFGFEFISVLLILPFFNKINLSLKFTHCLNLFVIIFLSIFVVPICNKNHQDFNLVEKRIMNSPPKAIIPTSNFEIPPSINRFILNPIAHNKWYPPFNGVFALDNFYKKEKLIFLPEKFITRATNTPYLYHNFSDTEDLSFYAKNLQIPHIHPINKVRFILNPCTKDHIPFYHRPFASKMSRYSTDTIDVSPALYATIEINNIPFLLVQKNDMIDNRVKDIIYE